MAFHPERLTGRRKRKYLQSLDWAPTITLPPKAPKHYTIKHPENLKALIRVGDNDKQYHYVAVIRNRVVPINHDHQKSTEFFAVMGDFNSWPCKCRKTIDWFVTWRHATNPYRKTRDGRQYAWIDGVTGLHPKLLELVNKMKSPNVAKVRKFQVYHGRREACINYASVNNPLPRIPQYEPYVMRLSQNKELEKAASDLMAAELLNFVSSKFNAVEVTAITGDYSDFVFTKTGSTLEVATCPYTWYVKIYKNPEYQAVIKQNKYFPLMKFKLMDRNVVMYLRKITDVESVANYSSSTKQQIFSFQSFDRESNKIFPDKSVTVHNTYEFKMLTEWSKKQRLAVVTRQKYKRDNKNLLNEES